MRLTYLNARKIFTRRYKMTKDSVKRAVAKYDAKNTIHIGLKFNKKTDKDILARLSKEPNKQGYIKKLIRADIKKGSKNRR